MPKISDWCRHLPEDVIRSALRLGRRMNYQFPIISNLLEPAGDVCRLILDHCRRDSGLGAQVSGSHLRDQLFDAVRRRSKGRGFKNRPAC